MPDPIYDPNKIVSRGYYKGEPSVQGDIKTSAPKYDPKKIVSKGYVPRDTVVKEGFTAGEVDGGSSDDELEKKLDFIQNKIPGERNLRDDERDILRDMMKNSNANQKDISDAILTFKGVHPEQVYNRKGPIRTTPEYYLDRDEKGVYKPVPLGENKSLPAEKQMASIWGTGKEAQDDAWYTDLAKKAFNIIPTVMEDVTDFVTAAAPTLRKIGNKIEGTKYEGSTVAESGKEAKKFFQQFKMPLSEEYNQSIYNSEDIKGFEDLISKDRVKLNLKNVYGTVSNLAASVGEMLLTGKVAGEGILSTKAAVKGVAPTLSKAEKYASVYTASYLTNLGEAMDAAKKAGISEEDAGAWAMAVTVPIAALDAGLGVGGKILSNKLANEGKKDLLQNIANNIVKDELGNVTEESLKKAATEAVKAYAPVAKGFISTVKLGSKDVLEQGTEEALQSFMSSAGEQLYDKLSDADKAKFGTDAFSAQSIGKYISEGVAGLVGSGPLAYSTAKAKQKELYNAQSNSAYEAVKEGEEGVKAFKTNITNAFEKGEINQQDYDNAMLKMDAYDSYNKVSSDLTLDDANKKKLFELSLQKENLKASIKAAEAKDTEGHSRLDKMTPPELGLHNAKVKQAKALQDDIDLIVAKSEIIQQPEVSESVVDKVIKEEEKAAAGPKERVKGEPKSEIGELLGRYGQIKVKEGALEEMVPNGQKYTPPKKVTDETRAMKDISPDEWNASDFDVTIKQHKFADALDAAPEKTVGGTLQEDNKFIDSKGREVQTFNVTLPNGKAVRFASSMVRHAEENSLGGFRGNTYEENLTNRENPIGQKVGATVRTLKDSGRKVIFIWNADEGPKYGKHVGMVKESMRGKSNYSEADLDEMADLRMLNMGENPNAPAPGIINPEGPINEGPAKKPSKEAPKSKPSKVDLREVQLKEKKDAKEVANRQKQAAKEEKIKEIKEKKENILRSTRAIKSLVNRYNDLSSKDKKSEAGLALLKNIKDKTNEIGYNLKLRDKGNLSLLDENDKLVYATPVKRSDDQKSYEAEKQRALRANPTSVQHAIVLDVANGKQFDVNNLRKYFSDDILKNEMPSLLKNSKGKGIKLEFYKTEIEEALGLKEDGGLDQEQVAEDAAAELEKYFVSGYREAAIQDAIEINFKTENGGLERDQIDALNRQAEEEEAKIRDVEEGMASPEIIEEELAKEEYRKLVEQEGYLQKVKPKAETISKFKQSVDLFYKAKDTDGASKRRAILEQRREFLEKNPSFKYIDDNMKYIYKELEQKGIIERFGECP